MRIKTVCKAGKYGLVISRATPVLLTSIRVDRVDDPVYRRVFWRQLRESLGKLKLPASVQADACFQATLIVPEPEDGDRMLRTTPQSVDRLQAGGAE